MSETDGVLGAVSGVYVASLVGVAAGLFRAGERVASAMVAVLGVAVGTVIVVGAGVTQSRGDWAVRVGGTTWAWLLVLPGFAVFALAGPAASLADDASIVFVAGGLASVLAAVALVVACQNRHAKRVLGEYEVLAEWRAGPSPARERRVTYGAAGALGLAVVLFAAGFATETRELAWAAQVLVPVAAAAYGATTTRTDTATAYGLASSGGVHTVARPWSTVRGLPRHW